MMTLFINLSLAENPYLPQHHGCMLECREDFYKDCNLIKNSDYTLVAKLYSKCIEPYVIKPTVIWGVAYNLIQELSFQK